MAAQQYNNQNLINNRANSSRSSVNEKFIHVSFYKRGGGGDHKVLGRDKDQRQ